MTSATSGSQLYNQSTKLIESSQTTLNQNDSELGTILSARREWTSNYPYRETYESLKSFHPSTSGKLMRAKKGELEQVKRVPPLEDSQGSRVCNEPILLIARLV